MMRFAEFSLGSCLFGILAATLGSAASAQPASSTRISTASYGSAVFSAGIEMVPLNVTVTDKRQQYVRDLTESDFAVFEDGVRRSIAVFDAGRVPVDLALLLDTSASIRDQIGMIRAAAIGFLNTLGPDDRATVVGFSHRVDVLQPWTGDRIQLESAIRRSSASGGTSLFTALYVALRSFGEARLGDQLRRQAIVVLSDGDDTSSVVSFDDALETCRRAGVSIYTIRMTRVGLDQNLALTLRRSAKSISPEYVMGTFAKETGARTYTLTKIRELAATYGSIADELSNQYVLGYYPGPRLAGALYRRVAVQVVGRNDAVARTRLGYSIAGGLRTQASR
jgi:VWFA-related protein